MQEATGLDLWPLVSYFLIPCLFCLTLGSCVSMEARSFLDKRAQIGGETDCVQYLLCAQGFPLVQGAILGFVKET